MGFPKLCHIEKQIIQNPTAEQTHNRRNMNALVRSLGPYIVIFVNFTDVYNFIGMTIDWVP